MSNENPLTLTRPADKSLQAYKDWINETVIALGGDTQSDDSTEEEWVADWQDFWSED